MLKKSAQVRPSAMTLGTLLAKLTLPGVWRFLFRITSEERIATRKVLFSCVKTEPVAVSCIQVQQSLRNVIVLFPRSLELAHIKNFPGMVGIVRTDVFDRSRNLEKR